MQSKGLFMHKYNLLITLTSLVTASILAMEQEQKNIQLQKTEKSRCKISELLENPRTPKRLIMEINNLLENKNFTLDAHSVDSKTHPFEIKVAFYNDNMEHALTYKMPHDYPFYAPILSSLETSNTMLTTQDLIAIKKKFNDDLKQIWNPARRMTEIVAMTHKHISSYEDQKIASQRVAQGYERTLPQIKEKYQTTNVYVNSQYPEFQEKLHGLWIKEMPSGYFVFHVEYNYINIAFEPKYIGAEPLSYHGYCAVGYHETHNNQFHIHISDTNDSGKINAFKIFVYSDHISIIFNSLQHDSILNAIISQLKMDDVIGERMDLIKI